jgi:hypothetical protein
MVATKCVSRNSRRLLTPGIGVPVLLMIFILYSREKTRVPMFGTLVAFPALGMVCMDSP